MVVEVRVPFLNYVDSETVKGPPMNRMNACPKFGVMAITLA